MQEFRRETQISRVKLQENKCGEGITGLANDMRLFTMDIY